MLERISYLFLFLGFFVLSGIGCYFGNDENTPWPQWISENGRWMILFANGLFLLLAIRQLAVWNIEVTADGVLLKRFLGLKKILLHKPDFISFKVEMHRDFRWMKNPRATIVVKLQTSRGKFTFNASDYKSFEQKILDLFSPNTEMRSKCIGQISRLKLQTGN